MNPSLKLCPVCQSSNSSSYITTRAMMHSVNSESYHFHRCEDCKSVFLKNRIEESCLEKYYTESYLPYRGNAAWGKFASFVEKDTKRLDRRRVDVVAKEIPRKNATIRLLDVGCGLPSFLELATDILDIHGTGIDFTDKGWQGKGYHQLDLHITSLAEYEPDKLFDIITLWHYLEHDYRLQETEKKLFELLKPGGKLIIEVPDYNSLTALIQKQYWQGWHSPRHTTLFSCLGFKKLFDHHRWKVVKHLRYGTLQAFTLWWLGLMERKQIDWSGSMEKEFWPLVWRKIITYPFFFMGKWIPMAVQLVVIQKKMDK